MVVLESPTNRRPPAASISRALSRVKQDLSAVLPESAIIRACEDGRVRVAGAGPGPGHDRPPVRPAGPELQRRLDPRPPPVGAGRRAAGLLPGAAAAAAGSDAEAA